MRPVFGFNGSVKVIRASDSESQYCGTLDFYQPPHFLAEVAAVVSRLKPDRAQQYIDNLAQLNISWAAPTAAYTRAIELARQRDHHLFDTLYHAVALSVPGAVLVTADRSYFAKAQHLGKIAWLADFIDPAL